MAAKKKPTAKKVPTYRLPKPPAKDHPPGYRYGLSEAQRQAVAYGVKHVCHELRRRGFKATPRNNGLYEMSRGKVEAEVHLNIEHAEGHCPRATLSGGWDAGRRSTKQFPPRRDYNAWVHNVATHVVEAYESRVARDRRTGLIAKAKSAVGQRLREALDTAGFGDEFRVDVNDHVCGRNDHNKVQADVWGKETTGAMTVVTRVYPDSPDHTPRFEATVRFEIDPERDLPELHKLLTGHRATLKVQVKS